MASSKLIQRDCPINPGNSGGPVLDVATGKVIGVTVSELGGAEGIKFAVPVTYLNDLIARQSTMAYLNRRLGEASDDDSGTLVRSKWPALSRSPLIVPQQPLPWFSRFGLGR